MTPKAALNIDDLRRAAHARLPRILFDWLEGGAEDERLLSQNTDQFSAFRLVPRYLVDISNQDQSCEILGRRYGHPFGIAPTGFAGLLRPNADIAIAEAAAECNMPHILSGAANASLERVAEVSEGRAWYQIYVPRDPAITADLLQRMKAAGLKTLVITVDCPAEAKRERDIRNGFGLPLKITPALVLDGIRHPGWTLSYLRNGGTPMMETWRPYAPKGARAMTVAQLVDAHFFAPHTWDHLKIHRQKWPGTLVVKGIQHPEDALKLVELGVDGIIVSNHGGRQLDRAPSSLEALPAIVAAVGNKAAVMVDGGFRRGSDIVIALALGARCVFLGRAILYGAAAFGKDGAARAIAILVDEVRRVMGQIGCNAVAELGADRVLDVRGDA